MSTFVNTKRKARANIIAKLEQQLELEKGVLFPVLCFVLIRVLFFVLIFSNKIKTKRKTETQTQHKITSYFLRRNKIRRYLKT